MFHIDPEMELLMPSLRVSSRMTLGYEVEETGADAGRKGRNVRAFQQLSIRRCVLYSGRSAYIGIGGAVQGNWF